MDSSVYGWEGLANADPRGGVDQSISRKGNYLLFLFLALESELSEPEIEKPATNRGPFLDIGCRGERIRTSDLTPPRRAL